MPEILPAVKALVTVRDRFLAIREAVPGTDATHWGLPGGKPEYLESPYAAIVRELQEEVGLTVELGQIVGMYWFALPNGSERVCTVFRCWPSTDGRAGVPQICVEDGILDYRWVTPAEFASPQYNVLHDSLKQLVAHVARTEAEIADNNRMEQSATTGG